MGQAQGHEHGKTPGPGQGHEHEKTPGPGQGHGQGHEAARGPLSPSARARLRRLGARAAPGPVRPPVEPVHLPELDERAVYRVLDFVLRAGEVLLAGGAGAADVTATITAAGRACGLERLEVDVTFTSITASYVRAPDVAPVTSLRLVRYRAVDYTVVTDVDNLVSDLVQGRTSQEEAFARLRHIRDGRHPYPRWVVHGAAATLSSSVTVLLGGAWLVAAVSFASTVVVALTLVALGRRHLPLFYANAVGASIATAAALGLAALSAPVRPSLVVAGGIILLLPGVTLVGSVQDAITGYYVTASGRAFETFLLTAGIISGVAVTLYVGVTLGVAIEVQAPTPLRLGQLAVQVVAAGVASAAFAVASSAPRRAAPAAGLAGALGFAAFRALELADVPPTFATFAAAMVVGLGAYTLSQRQRVPALVYVASGIIPLLPGLTIYRGMLQLAGASTVPGLVTLGQAATVSLALAAGVILGEFLAQPGEREVRRWERRMAGPRLAGPPLRARDPDTAAPPDTGTLPE